MKTILVWVGGRGFGGGGWVGGGGCFCDGTGGSCSSGEVSRNVRKEIPRRGRECKREERRQGGKGSKKKVVAQDNLLPLKIGGWPGVGVIETERGPATGLGGDEGCAVHLKKPSCDRGKIRRERIYLPDTRRGGEKREVALATPEDNEKRTFSR